MAAAVVEAFLGITGLTLTVDMYPLGSDTIDVTAMSLTEATNRKGLYTGTTTAAVSGEHQAFIKSGSTVIAVGYVFMDNTTNLHRIIDNAADASQDIGGVSSNIGAILGTVSKGAAGSVAPDWGQVQNPTTTVGLTNTTISTSQVVASVTGAVGSVTGAVGSISGITFPTHFSATLITAAGNVGIDWGNVANPTTTLALTNTTMSPTQQVSSVSGNVAGSVVGSVGSLVSPGNIWDVALAGHLSLGSTGAALNNAALNVPPTTAQISTAVWQDTTAGDFTVASSIGKSLYTSGVVPGASGGLFIAGSNAATTVNFTGNLSGSVGSVTGAVGSVTGNVGGNVVGTVASVVSVGNVWDVVLSGHLTAGTTGAALNAAGSAGDPWSTTIPGAYGAGTAGHRLGNIPDLVAGAAGGIFIAGSNAATTVNFTGSLSGSVGSVTGAVGSVTGNIGGNLNGNVVGSVGSVTGNVSGSVASVTGSVGSVTGSVGSVAGNVSGNVVGSTASVTGSVGSVAGSVAGDVQGKVLGGGVSTITGAGVRADQVTGSVGSVTGSVGSVVGSVGSIAGITFPSGFSTLTTSTITSAIYANTVRGYTLTQMLSVWGGVLSGPTSGLPTNPVIKAMDNSQTVLTATLDVNGNRSAITITP